MKAHEHEKIPVPAERRWAEFRQRYIPLIVFIVVGLTVWYLWSEQIERTVMTGQVQGDQIEITASEPGYLANLTIQDFDEVQAGEPIGEIVTTDPDVLESRLAVINAEIDLIRHSMDPIAGLQRNQINLYDLQMDLMENQITLASNRIQKIQLQRDLERSEELFEQDAIAEEEVEQLQTELEQTQAEITNAESLAASMEQRLSTYNMPDYGTSSADSRDAIASAIEVQREELELVKNELSPQTLEAPMDGKISQVHHRNGAHLQDDQPIATIVSGQPDYILGYLTHPVDDIPEIGREIQIYTQGHQQKVGEAEIVDIGNHYIEIEEQYLTPANQQNMLGLPVKVTVTSDIDLMPGELVDLSY